MCVPWPSVCNDNIELTLYVINYIVRYTGILLAFAYRKIELY